MSAKLLLGRASDEFSEIKARFAPFNYRLHNTNRQSNSKEWTATVLNRG